MVVLDAPGQAEGPMTVGFAPLVAEMRSASASAAAWRLHTSTDGSGPWLRVSHAQARPPAQGWKLHVSATVASAVSVLRATLPTLLAESATFKLVSSLSALSHLNAGNGGPTQVGKFITIYPNDDAQAVRLAVALDGATRGLAGPMIASDRQLHPGSRVSYRYGGFDHLVLQTPIGEVLPALRAPDGRLVPDRRALYYDPPAWAVDPFVAAGVATPPPAPDVIVGERYALVSTLYRSPRGALYLAVDLDVARRCVLKRARRHAMEGPDGRDARDRLHAEARALAALAPDPRFPAVFDLFEDGGDLYLALEDVEGETLEHQIHERTAQGRIASSAEVIAWGRELAAMLHTVHARGFLSRDVKPSNVIVAPDGRLRLIDFDIAHCMTDPPPRSGKGTRGYFSPQQHVADVPAVTDDIYGLGALLYFLATSAEPSQAPDQFALLDRPPTLLNPAISPALERVIARCLDPDPAKRYPSMQAVETALAAVDTAPSLPAPSFDGERAPEPSVEAQRRHRALAQRLADTICGAAQPAPNGQGLAWATRHPVSAGGVHTRDLNAGNAGTLLAMAELAAVFADPAHRTTLAEGARWLAVAPPFEGELLPGLYVGEAGIGAALLRAGQVLGDAALIAEAAARGRLVASLPFRSPDLFNGTAGRLRFHLLLWDETRAADHLTAAVQAGASLLAAAQDTGKGGICWPMPPDFGGLTGAAYLGYAHGAAGIADALLDLYEATGDTRLRDAARGAARWLTRLARPALGVPGRSPVRRGLGNRTGSPSPGGTGGASPVRRGLGNRSGSPSQKDASGLGWPAIDGQAPSAPFWCHGAAGIGRFFLHAARLGILPEAGDVAAAAARATAHAARWAGPTPCHGLAGAIEFLLDMFQATGDRAYLADAGVLARLLEAFAAERDGALVFPSESPDVFTPDYMVGYAGVAACLLRLSAPARLPHLLSRAGFRRSAARWPGRGTGASPISQTTQAHAAFGRSTT